MHKHEKINYLEIPARDMTVTKAFFTSVFAWSFMDYGPDYTAFSNAGIDGGFYKTDLCSTIEAGSPLIVFYSQDLRATQMKIENAGGGVLKSIFEFPGGHRFHFTDPNGNQFAVWSDTYS